MARRLSFALGLVDVAAAVLTATVGCNSGSGGAAPDRCPAFQSVNVCVPASSNACVNGDAMIGCGLAGLPTGLPCSDNAQCSLQIYPCPGELQSFIGGGRADGYICTCVSSKWSCDDCALGTALCGGPPTADTGADAGDASTDAGADGSGGVCVPDSSSQVIVASSYEQSCNVDKDCVAIAEGNVCDPCVFDGMLNAAINASAMAKYNSDIAGTPGATGIGGAGCTTGGGTVSGNSNWGPFCCSGTCHVGSQCPNTAAAVDAGADVAADAAGE